MLHTFVDLSAKQPHSKSTSDAVFNRNDQIWKNKKIKKDEKKLFNICPVWPQV